MSKPHRTRKARSQKPRRRSRAAGPSPDPTGAPTDVVDRRLDGLAHSFDQWGGSDPDAVTFAQVGEPLAFAFRSLAVVLGRCEVTDWDPDDMAFLFDVVVPEVGLDHDAQTVLAASIHQFGTFLGDTGRWTGSPHALSAALLLLQALAEIPDLGDDEMRVALTAAARTPVAPAVELAGLRRLPVVVHLDALLTWLGPGRAVTGTGALRLADVPAAAQLVGVSVRTSGRTSDPEQLTLDAIAIAGEPSTAGPEVPVVASMWDVPELASVWVTAAETGLIEIGSTRVRPTGRCAEWRRAADHVRVDLAREAVARHLDARLARVLTESIFGPSVVAPTVSAFFGALSGDALSEAMVARVVANTDARTGRAPEPAIADLTLELAGAQLAEMLSAGLLRLDPDEAEGSVYRVPDALVPAVAHAMLRFVGGDGAVGLS